MFHVVPVQHPCTGRMPAVTSMFDRCVLRFRPSAAPCKFIRLEKTPTVKKDGAGGFKHSPSLEPCESPSGPCSLPRKPTKPVATEYLQRAPGSGYPSRSIYEDQRWRRSLPNRTSNGCFATPHGIHYTAQCINCAHTNSLGAALIAAWEAGAQVRRPQRTSTLSAACGEKTHTEVDRKFFPGAANVVVMDTDRISTDGGGHGRTQRRSSG